MNYKLIKLPEGYIIISDEEIKENEISWNGGSIFERFRDRWMESDWKKIIASSFMQTIPQIEFDLSDEDAKKISGIYTDYNIEIEMDKIPADRAPNGWDVFPKINDGKIKITKIL